jgi:hypothetical protein
MTWDGRQEEDPSLAVISKIRFIAYEMKLRQYLVSYHPKPQGLMVKRTALTFSFHFISHMHG